ncbi:MAG: LptF/LptG family permease [Rhodospirillaceae bacterium]|nr:MAG: LptF/LptG family permease [Rhodospirillaceae bacterium]
MNEMTRYIFRQLVAGTILVSAALCCIVWLTQSLRFLQFVVNKGLALSAWIKLTLLLLPNFLAVVIPPSLFFVVLFTYNKLTLDRELIVAQAAGISRLSLTKPALWAATVAAVVCLFLTLLVVPESLRTFKEIQWAMRNDVSQMLLREGAFNQIVPGLTMYVRARAGQGELHGILVHDARDPTAVITLLAERGVLASGANGPHVMLINGTRQQLTGDGTGLTMLYFDSYTVDFGNLSSPTTDRLEDVRERSIVDLFSVGMGDGFTGGEVARMRAEGHQRIIAPLTTFAYTLAALVFLLTGGFDRRGQFMRISCAIAALVGLETAGLGAADLAGRAPLFVPLMYAVGLLPTALGLYIIATPVDWGPVWRRLVQAAST